jgi:hypothetical protein
MIEHQGKMWSMSTRPSLDAARRAASVSPRQAALTERRYPFSVATNFPKRMS